MHLFAVERPWHTGEGCSHTGAGVEATKRLQHLLDLRGGAELEDSQTNIDLFCPAFAVKDMEYRRSSGRPRRGAASPTRRPHGAAAGLVVHERGGDALDTWCYGWTGQQPGSGFSDLQYCITIGSEITFLSALV
jgi:hypothetical protein